MISEVKMNSQEPVYTQCHNTKERRIEKQAYNDLKSSCGILAMPKIRSFAAFIVGSSKKLF
jgi:hypothetical protein